MNNQTSTDSFTFTSFGINFVHDHITRYSEKENVKRSRNVDISHKRLNVIMYDEDPTRGRPAEYRILAKTKPSNHGHNGTVMQISFVHALTVYSEWIKSGRPSSINISRDLVTLFDVGK